MTMPVNERKTSRLSRRAVIWWIIGGVAFSCIWVSVLANLLGDTQPASDVQPETTTTASSTAEAPATTLAPVVTTPAAPPTVNAPPPATTEAPPPPPQTDPRFGSCAEAIRNGYGPYYKGVDPEYAWYQDRDGDGKVCER